MEPKKIDLFRRTALITTLATYFLIFVGGLVRVSGAGLGCPDWPKCFGRWIPPLSKADVPPEFSTDLFNVTLAWIEYINRLIGVVVGILILLTAILALRYLRSQKHLLYPSLLAAILVAFQGWYGSVVVATKLQPLTVSIHMALALSIVSLLIYVTQSVTYLKAKRNALAARWRNWLMGIWILTLIQIILGTQVRSGIESLLNRFPLMTDQDVLVQLGSINYVHGIIGLLLIALMMLFTLKVINRQQETSGYTRSLSVIGMTVLLLQIMIGSGMVILGIPQIYQVFHLWLASIFIGLTIMLYVEIKYKSGESYEESQ